MLYSFEWRNLVRQKQLSFGLWFHLNCVPEGMSCIIIEGKLSSICLSNNEVSVQHFHSSISNGDFFKKNLLELVVALNFIN